MHQTRPPAAWQLLVLCADVRYTLHSSPKGILAAGGSCCGGGKDNSGDMGAVVAPRVRLAKPGTCLRVVSTHCLRKALRGRVEYPADFTLEDCLCRPTSSDESAPGVLMGHLETPSQRSLVKDLGFE